jgi:hypothetical protein
MNFYSVKIQFRKIGITSCDHESATNIFKVKPLDNLLKKPKLEIYEK